MKRLTLPLLLCGATLAHPASSVNQAGGVRGPVRMVTQVDYQDPKSPQAYMGDFKRVSWYDQRGRLVKEEEEGYEYSHGTAFEYEGDCLKRETEENRYVDVVRTVKVHFNDSKCEDAQLVTYENGVVVGRTVTSRAAGTLTRLTYRKDNSVDTTERVTCTSDGLDCTSKTTSRDGSQTVERTVLWPSRVLKLSSWRKESEDGDWSEWEGTYNERGWVTTSRSTRLTHSGDQGQPLPEGKLVSNRWTFRYKNFDAYGNWKTREDFKVVKAFGKETQIPDGGSRREYKYQ